MSENYWEQPGYPKHECMDHDSDPDHCTIQCAKATEWLVARIAVLGDNLKARDGECQAKAAIISRLESELSALKRGPDDEAVREALDIADSTTNTCGATLAASCRKAWASIKDLTEELSLVSEQRDGMAEKLEKAQAEVERLRAALKVITKAPCYCWDLEGEICAVCYAVQALSPKPCACCHTVPCVCGTLCLNCPVIRPPKPCGDCEIPCAECGWLGQREDSFGYVVPCSSCQSPKPDEGKR